MEDAEGMEAVMVKPFIGLPANDLSGTCGHAPDLDQPSCDAAATVHLLVQDEAWGMVSLATCDAHLATAEASSAVLERHPYGGGCSASEPMFLPTHCEP